MANSLLYSQSININDKIKIRIPTVGEIFDNEDEYFRIASLICATPFDMMVFLDDNDIDFTTIDDFELFCYIFPDIKKRDTSLIFGDLDLSNFEFAINQENNTIALRDEKQGITIDKAVHYKIGRALREINNFGERINKRPANEEGKKFLLERTRKKQERNARKPKKSQLEDLIIAMVNTGEFSYDFDSVRRLSIFQFNASVRQVVKKINYDNTMIGCYAGTISVKDLNPSQLDWLTNK